MSNRRCEEWRCEVEFITMPGRRDLKIREIYRLTTGRCCLVELEVVG